MKKRGDRSAGRVGRLGFALLSLLLVVIGQVSAAPDPSPPDPTPQPGLDRLAVPPLPESPTTVDIGRRLYYFHCMPCHGDRGQGLTDEWRQVWVEDHRNCWARGCHAGKSETDAFYLPHYVPPVIGSPFVLHAFPTAEDLFAFLEEKHPPQRPGALSETEYWALTAFLLHENGRPLPDRLPGSRPDKGSVEGGDLVLATLLPLAALLLARRLTVATPRAQI